MPTIWSAPAPCRRTAGAGEGARAASYVRVQDPAAGFFVGGSSNEGVNGLYARTERLPASLKGTQRRFSLLYFHMDSGWHLGFVESADDARASEMEWVFIDAAGGDRMFLSENTLIPAAGERWSRLPASPSAVDRGGPPARGRGTPRPRTRSQLPRRRASKRHPASAPMRTTWTSSPGSSSRC